MSLSDPYSEVQIRQDLRSVLYCKYKCGIGLDSILEWKWNQVKPGSLRKYLYAFPAIKGMIYLPFSPWHLMEIWPLVKIAEWGASEDKKTRVGWKRNSCRLSSTQLNHIDDNGLNTVCLYPHPPVQTSYFMKTNILVLLKPWDFNYEPHSDWSRHPNALKIKFSSLSLDLYPEHIDLFLLINSKTFNIWGLNCLHLTFGKHLTQFWAAH